MQNSKIVIMKTKYLLITLACALPLSAAAQVLDLNINASAAEAQYIYQGEYAENFASGFSGYFNDENVRYLSIDLQSRLEAVQNSGIIFAMGANLFLFEQQLNTDDDTDDISLGLGFLLSSGYRFSLNEIPTQIVLNLNYSPNIVNTGEIDSLMRANLRSEFHVTPSVITYLGIRNDSASYSDDKIDVDEPYDSKAMLGFRVKF